LVKKPTAIIESAVKGMLPKNRLGSALFRNLFVYTGPDHPHQAQQPKEINLNSIK
ncbi:MAG: uL13 family ribosomal protein, partial [bacterium]